MRKLVLILFAMIFPVWGGAQPKAVGVRVGLIDWAVSYQHYSGQREDFIETTMSIMPTKNDAVGVVSVLYNFSIHEWNLVRGGCNLYAGAGLGIGGSRSMPTYRREVEHEVPMVKYRPGLFMSVPVQFGFEYKSHNVPFQISLDFRPHVALSVCPSKEYGTGWCFDFQTFIYTMIPGLGLRYSF